MLQISGIGVASAFLAGLISFLSPCVLPLVPGYVSYVAGRSVERVRDGGDWGDRLRVVWLSLLFSLGFSAVFITLGAGATAISQLLLAYRYELSLVAGGIVILFGLFMMGLLPLSWLYRDVRFTAAIGGGRPMGAFILGLAFAFGWTPCIGPVLGSILALSAFSSQLASGVSLLAIYSLGLAVPFLLVAAFTGTFLRHVRVVRRFGRPLQFGAGAVMAVMGAAMTTGDLTTLSFWLLDTIPMLQEIG
jgi:cytochrome c-type biogenesis protein